MSKRIFVTISEITADILRFAGLKIYKVAGFIQQKIAGTLITAAIRIEVMHNCRSMFVDKYRCEYPRNHGNTHKAHTNKGVELWDDPI